MHRDTRVKGHGNFVAKRYFMGMSNFRGNVENVPARSVRDSRRDIREIDNRQDSLKIRAYEGFHAA